MLSLPASVPARRVACAIVQSNVLTSQHLVSLHYGHPLQQLQQQQRRQYAMRAPSLSRRTKPGPATPVALPDFPFKNVPLPPIEVWREFKDKRGLGDLAPETCLQAFMQYCLIAPKDLLSVEPAHILERGTFETSDQPVATTPGTKSFQTSTSTSTLCTTLPFR